MAQSKADYLSGKGYWQINSVVKVDVSQGHGTGVAYYGKCLEILEIYFRPSVQIRGLHISSNRSPFWWMLYRPYIDFKLEYSNMEFQYMELQYKVVHK